MRQLCILLLLFSMIQLQAEEKKETGISRSDANLRAQRISGQVIIDGKLNEGFYDSVEWSAPFMVLGNMSQDINGLWVEADSKFKRSAATATLFYDEAFIYAAFKVPFPEDMQPKAEMQTGQNIWQDDCIEFFLHPGGERYFQILVNAKGAWQGLQHTIGGGNPLAWNSESIKVAAVLEQQQFSVELAVPYAEIGKTAAKPGEYWRGNFAREGATCGGLSTWAAVGTSFLAPDRFGKIIFASRKAYFESFYEELSAEIGKISQPGPELHGELQKFQQLLQKDGENPSAWLNLHNQIDIVRNRIVQQINSGKKLLLLPTQMFENFPPQRKVPYAEAELTELSLESPGGARAITAFLLANLSENMNMSNLLFKADKGSEAIEPLLRFREVGYIELNGGRMIPDPIFDLPMDSMLRVPGNSTVMVWLDIDCAKLPPGNYSGSITLYPSYSGFEEKKLAFKLTVSTVDIAKTFVRNWTYAIRDAWTIEALKEYEFNCFIPIPHHYYPQYDEDGKAIFPRLDEMIQAFLDNGLDLSEVFILFYPEFSLWANMKLPDGSWQGFMGEQWQVELRKRLLLLRDYLQEKYNISYEQYAFYPTDEPNGDPENPKDKAYFGFVGGRFIKSVDPKFQLFINPYKLNDGRQQQYFDLFEILEPFYPQMTPELIKQYAESGREIWTYSIFEKSVSAPRYRHLFWENMHSGFKGPATFYDMFACSGDAFNSYDSSADGKVIADYGAAYRNTRLKRIIPSRRLEAWYMGYVEFKLARLCENRLAELRQAGNSVAEFEEQLKAILELGFKANGSMDEARKELLKLAESLP